jgi:hypothetical protein
MAGELVYEGFLSDAQKAAGKDRLEALLARLNAGETVSPADIEAAATLVGDDRRMI